MAVTKKAGVKKAATKKASTKKGGSKKVIARKSDTQEVTLEQALAESGETMDDLKEPQKNERKKRTGPSKVDLAKDIFKEEWDKAAKEKRKVVRKDVILRFMSEANLTKAGSATYYANIKKAYGQ